MLPLIARFLLPNTCFGDSISSNLLFVFERWLHHCVVESDFLKSLLQCLFSLYYLYTFSILFLFTQCIYIFPALQQFSSVFILKKLASVESYIIVSFFNEKRFYFLLFTIVLFCLSWFTYLWGNSPISNTKCFNCCLLESKNAIQNEILIYKNVIWKISYAI